MVDFQSRDTSRGYGDEAEEPSESTSDESAEEEDGRKRSDEREEDAAGTEGTAAGERSEGDAPGSGDTTESSDSTTPPDPGGLPADRSETDRSESEGAEAEDGTPSSSNSDPLAPSSSDSEPSTEPDDGDSLADAADHGSESASAAGPGQGTASRESAETANERRGRDEPEQVHERSQGGDSQARSHDAGRSRADNGHAQTNERDQGHAEAGDHGHEHAQTGGRDHGHTHAEDVALLGVAVVTVSSTRTREDDPSGDVVEAVVEASDHRVVTREILRDDLDGVQNALLHLTGRDDVDVVVTTGGTGVTPDDVTVEAARPLFDRELPGFGELFRILSYEEVGTRAIASRATAGTVGGVAVFCLPGSEAAARLGTEELIVEEMAHLVGLARRDD